MSSKRALRHRGCAGKVAYPFARVASEACEKARARTGDQSITVYRCGRCGMLHLGHAPGMGVHAYADHIQRVGEAKERHRFERMVQEVAE